MPPQKFFHSIDAADLVGKPLGQLRIANPDVEELRPRQRHGAEDSLDAGLVWSGFLLSPVNGFVVPCHARLLAAAVLLIGGIGARFC